jgi:hypothetical protein
MAATPGPATYWNGEPTTAVKGTGVLTADVPVVDVPGFITDGRWHS